MMPQAQARTVSFQRPDNTTAYTAGDVVGVADAVTPANAGSAVLQFSNIGPAGGSILLVDWSLMIALSSVPAGMGAFRLNLYDAAPDAILDNAAWDLSSADDRSKYLGYLDMGTPVDVGSTLFVQVQQQPKQVKLANGSTTLFGVLRTIAAYTPAALTQYAVKINAANA